jgi:hypothetical protein
MATKTAKELVKDAQREALSEVTRCRRAQLDALKDYEELGGVDDYQESLADVVKEYTKGIGLSVLRAVFPDAALLNAAREALKDAGRLTEEKKGATVILKPGKE